MPESTESFAAETLRLRDEFPPVSAVDWDAAVRADLQGADYEKKLIWRTEEGIAVRPYYRAEDIHGLEAHTHAIPGVFPYVRGSGSQEWQINDPGTPIPADAIRADHFAEQGGTVVQELGYAL